MPHLPFTRRGLLIGLFTITVIAAGTADSQNLSGNVTEIAHPGYSSISSQFRISDAQANGTYIFEGDIIILCSDLDGTSLDDGSTSFPLTLTSGTSTLSLGTIDDFDVWNRYSTPQDEALAKAQAHWLIDNFYETYFVDTPSGERHVRQYAFQNALWEIMGDGGTSSGLDFTNGNINRSRFSSSGSSSSPNLWSHMNTLINAVNSSGIDSGYQEQLTVHAVLDSRNNYQDYFAFATTTQAMAVPEPSSSCLFLSAAGLLLIRRSRF